MELKVKKYFTGYLPVILILVSGCTASSRFYSEGPETKRVERIERDEPFEPEELEPKDLENIPVEAPEFDEENILETDEGIASYYGKKFHGKNTTSGEVYDMYRISAAHVSYPMNTWVKVTNLLNGRSIILKINDRMPDTNGRIIDLSYKAAEEIDMITSGITKVRIDVIEWGIE